MSEIKNLELREYRTVTKKTVILAKKEKSRVPGNSDSGEFCE